MRTPITHGRYPKCINGFICALSLCSVVIVFSTCALADEKKSAIIQNLRTVEKAFTQLADKTRVHVVAIVTYQSTSSVRANHEPKVLNQGSGFVLGAEGLIVTNHHVIAGAASITVVLADGTRHIANIVGTDDHADLAVLRIPARNLAAAPLSDLSHVTVGQWAFVIGNPYGLAAGDGHTSFTAGVVSGLGRSLAGLFEEYDDRYLGNMIETDIYLKPGYSGGPMFNIDGEVMGISAAVVTKENLAPTGFAIPITQRTRHILKALSQGISIQYGSMGAYSRTVSKKEAIELGLPQQGGAMITKVSGGGSKNPAARAGIRRRDVITQFGDRTILTADVLHDVATSTPIGEAIDITYYRKGEAHQTSIILIDRKELADDRHRNNESRVAVHMLTWHGCLLVEATEYYRDLNNLSKDIQGLYISQIQPNTLAAISGLKPHMFITKYNEQKVTTINSFIEVDDQVAQGIARIELSTGEVINVSTTISQDILSTH